MEILAIQTMAARQQQEVVATGVRLQALQQEIDRLKSDRRNRRIGEVASLFATGLGDRVIGTLGMLQLIHENRTIQRINHSIDGRRYEARTMEQHLHGASRKARLLLNLARRAIGGNVYAKHQANFIVGLGGATI